MKEPLYIFLFLYCMLTACNKTNNITNYQVNDHLQAFAVEGLHDVTLSTDETTANLNITVRYTDSGQQRVHVYVTGLPDGITIDTSSLKDGYPTYSFSLRLQNNVNSKPALTGDYIAQLNVAGELSGLKQYPFTVHVVTPDVCSFVYTGIYQGCRTTCGAVNFSDTITADVAEPGKLWFSNFMNQGARVYAYVQCKSQSFVIPQQVLPNGDTMSGTGNKVLGSALYNLVFSVKSRQNNCTVYIQ